MKFIKITKKDIYTKIDNRIWEFKLKANAFMVYCWCRSQSDTWVFKQWYLQQELGIGEKAFRTAIKELENKNLIKRSEKQNINSDGTFGSFDYYIFDADPDFIKNYDLKNLPHLHQGDTASKRDGVKATHNKNKSLTKINSKEFITTTDFSTDFNFDDFYKNLDDDSKNLVNSAKHFANGMFLGNCERKNLTTYEQKSKEYIAICREVLKTIKPVIVKNKVVEGEIIKTSNLPSTQEQIDLEKQKRLEKLVKSTEIPIQMSEISADKIKYLVWILVELDNCDLKEDFWLNEFKKSDIYKPYFYKYVSAFAKWVLKTDILKNITQFRSNFRDCFVKDWDNIMGSNSKLGSPSHFNSRGDTNTPSNSISRADLEYLEHLIDDYERTIKNNGNPIRIKDLADEIKQRIKRYGGVIERDLELKKKVDRFLGNLEKK